MIALKKALTVLLVSNSIVLYSQTTLTREQHVYVAQKIIELEECRETQQIKDSMITMQKVIIVDQAATIAAEKRKNKIVCYLAGAAILLTLILSR